MNAADILKLVRWAQRQVPDGSVRLVETHISWVLMMGDEVYKIKKPVRYSFVDFSTLELRRHFCETEVVLNRRLAPDMYLGVSPIRIGLEGPYLHPGPDPIVEYAVRMKRMDEALRMDRVVARQEAKPEQLRELALQLAAFHTSADRVREAETWVEHRDEFTDVLGVLPRISGVLPAAGLRNIQEVCERIGPMLHGLSARIESRKTAGFVIDGHGDLHCGNIFLTEPPVIFDCIEFSHTLRTLDVLSEVAFLYMDLERLGRSDLAVAFMETYREAYPCLPLESDHQLFLFYKLYRANVKLKVAALGLEGAKANATTLEGVRGYYRMFRTYASELLPN